MNPTELRWNITPIVVTVLGLLLALCLGFFIGGTEIISLGIIFGIVVVVTTIATMRQHVWLLLPMFWGFVGTVQLLPIPFTVRDLVVMFVGAVGFALLGLRIYRFKNRWDGLDLILFLNLAQILVVFITHPFGLKVLSSSERVGAKPYFNVVIAVIAYFIVCNQIITGRIARRLPLLVLIPELTTASLYLIGRIKTSVGYVMGIVYSGLMPELYYTGGYGGAPVQRLGGAVNGGLTLVNTLCSYFRPLTLITPFFPLRMLAFAAGVALILASGFRSQFLTIGVIFALAGYFRRGPKDLIVSATGFLFGIAALVVFNAVIYPLPLSMQRTLSFLPGQWDARAKQDALNSTEWRLEMWKDIPKGTQYINNKIIGDGFGFSRAELSAMERQKYSTGGVQQEDFMIIGAFHNGPLSAIRFAGIVGLTFFYILLIYSAVYACRLIRRAQDTDFFPLALFVGLLIIWEPFNYTLVFGAYDAGLPNAIFNVGMLKMIANSLTKQSAKVASEKMDAPALANRPVYAQ